MPLSSIYVELWGVENPHEINIDKVRDFFNFKRLLFLNVATHSCTDS